MRLSEAIDHCKDVIANSNACAECRTDHQFLLELLKELDFRRKHHYDIFANKVYTYEDGTVIKAGQKYKHYMGKVYEVVVPCVIYADDKKPYVIYRGVENARRMWARPIEEFLSEMPAKYNGVKWTFHRRFELMEEQI